MQSLVFAFLFSYFLLPTVERRLPPLEYVPTKDGQTAGAKLVVMGKGPMGLELPCLILLSDGTVVWDAAARSMGVTMDFEKLGHQGYEGGSIQVAFETVLTSGVLELLGVDDQIGALWDLDMDGYQQPYGGRYVNEIFVELEGGLLILRSNHEYVERSGGRILTSTGIVESSEHPLEYILANEPSDYANFRIAWEVLKGFALDVISLAESQPYGPQTSVISSRMREEGE